ncbi:MAG: hypothetical protein KJZ58_01470 [Flavobacteriales bacterium]|nr:hypothetical protein [Flavobacteriales bacterium]MCL4280908.1 hypothetical protein [Flavobacteriales bacterium]
MKELIDLYAAYDLWANTRIIERLQRESEPVLDRHVKSSFPSLRATLDHIRDSDDIWSQRIFGTAPMQHGDGIDGLLKVSVALSDRVRGLAGADLMAEVGYARANGIKYVQPRWQLLLHCFNHASYHRGQVITIMRQLDLAEVPNTDMVAYQRLLQAKK